MYDNPVTYKERIRPLTFRASGCSLPKNEEEENEAA
jgi:hypothetical protein